MRAAIVSALEGITLGEADKAHPGDVFRHVTLNAPGASSTVDRLFILERSRPQSLAGAQLGSADYLALGFSLSVLCGHAPTVTDRMLDDGDLVVQALRDLPQQNAQLIDVQADGGADIIDDATGSRAAAWEILAIYDARSPG